MRMIHDDHLRTPHKMTDSTGTVVWSADYKPFGGATVTVSTITNNLRFPGQYFDAETGLHYNYYRDYNTALDRFIEADPIGTSGGINLYLYAIVNSLRYTDTRGLEPGGGPGATISAPPSGLLGGPGATIGNPPGPTIQNPPPPPGPPVPKCWKFNQEKYAACLAENTFDPTLFSDIAVCLSGRDKNQEQCTMASGALYMYLFGCRAESYDEVPRTNV